MSQPPTTQGTTPGTTHTRRFIQSAWALLTFQLIAAALAVAVTGWAAFSVNRALQGQAGFTPPPAAASPVEGGVDQPGPGGGQDNAEGDKPGDDAPSFQATPVFPQQQAPQESPAKPGAQPQTYLPDDARIE